MLCLDEYYDASVMNEQRYRWNDIDEKFAESVEWINESEEVCSICKSGKFYLCREVTRKCCEEMFTSFSWLIGACWIPQLPLALHYLHTCPGYRLLVSSSSTVSTFLSIHKRYLLTSNCFCMVSVWQSLKTLKPYVHAVQVITNGKFLGLLVFAICLLTRTNSVRYFVR